MTSLIPSHASEHIVDGISEYLATSFSLADHATADSLKEFLTDSAEGMFHGPYVRTRLPYAPATDWEHTLSWLPENFRPYRHQAEAFARLSSANPDGTPRRPEPTLVVTGTGSGKTESFLYPILDHCLRHIGTPGIKALILYPMNALANDQASRLATLLSTDPHLRGIRAGLYTGEASHIRRTTVSAAGLITDRATMQADPPDILLTNYKMLDLMLLRDSDRSLWEPSATTLQYAVLDEFHTYDGAQGTDVALLLRRLGLRLADLRREAGIRDDNASVQDSGAEARDSGAGGGVRPLGNITPVATSATLGDSHDTPTDMLAFAHTIFGEELPHDSVVRETNLTLDQWTETIADFTEVGARSTAAPTIETIRKINTSIDSIRGFVHSQALRGSTYTHDAIVYDQFQQELITTMPASISQGAQAGDTAPNARWVNQAMAAASQNEWIRRVIAATQRPVALAGVAEPEEQTLVERLFSAEEQRQLGEDARTFLTHTLTLIAYLRALFGRVHGWQGKLAPGVEAQLWVREVSRIDRAVELDVAGPEMFRWSDDGTTDGNWLPACYCRNCGRSGWMTCVQPGDEFVDTSPATIRFRSMRSPHMRRPLIAAGGEARGGYDRTEDDTSALMWLDLPNAVLTPVEPEAHQQDEGGVVPVLVYAGDDADDQGRQDTCPSCGEVDAIRYLGSSVATLLSVAVSNLFGMEDLDAEEKSALVFTDSVQDAAHRAGFMQARARTFAFRGRIHGVIDSEVTLAELPDRLIDSADGDEHPLRARYELLPPRVTENQRFRAFWDPEASAKQQRAADKAVREVLAVDVALEFGERADLARSLVSTGTLAVGVTIPTETLRAAAQQACEALQRSADGGMLLGVEESIDGAGGPDALLAWARAIVETVRMKGGIYCRLFDSYLRHDGNSYMLNRRESVAKGVPRFPRGGAPTFPRLGTAHPRLRDATMPIADTRGWYTRWTARHLRISTAQAAHLVTELFTALAAAGAIGSMVTESKARIFYLRPDSITISTDADPEILECDVCARRLSVDAQARAILAGIPCHSLGCAGHYQVVDNRDNYYRSLYQSGHSRTVIAREHTSLLPTADRLAVEEQFKASHSEQHPDAPNVLVATPTLEMGIDIGDLSTVLLASLPSSVASYVQRIGRAGRLSGNSLAIAVIRGRGKALARLERPLATIDGVVEPPAAYLSAREILHRQFLAYVIDTMDFPALGIEASQAHSVFGHAPTTVITGLIKRLSAGVDRLLDAFIATLGPFATDDVTAELRHWATTDAAPALNSARETWRAQRDLLIKRYNAVGQLIEELRRLELSGTADDDVSDQLAHATAVSRFLSQQLSTEFRNEYWVNCLERVGLLPNFTLLDNAVDFRLTVSRFNADDGEIQTEVREYSRGISAALYELAPGADFYVQGIHATIDSVELGPDNTAIQRWRLCPTCSYSDILTANDHTGPCPECGEARFADAAQVKPVVEMSKVYASVDYSRSAITDSSDDRSIVRFEHTLSMVIPADGYGDAWFLHDSGFGVHYLPTVEMRWLNLGRVEDGTQSLLCGNAVSAPMFRVCRHCGHLDSEAGANRWQDHKPWCPQRNALDEDTVSFALGRRLTTQGVLMDVPASITAADDNAAPSLIAAVRMGFKLALGGNPDHLDVERVFASSHGMISPKLLLHDTIPGGTGYLAQFASARDIHRLLLKAYERLAACPCQHDARQACPECLLPYAQSSEIPMTSRESAMAALAKILLDDLHPEGTVDAAAIAGSWEARWDGRITEEAPAPSERSQLEVMFLEQLREELGHLGASIHEATVGTHARWTITFPGSPHVWTMQEQRDLGHTRPDFFFDTDASKVNAIAVYLDGYEFHASARHNSVARDMRLRRGLAEEGITPWSLTMADLQRRRERSRNATIEYPAWYYADARVRQWINQNANLQDTHHEMLVQDPVLQLLRMLKEPTAPWPAVGKAATYHTIATVQHRPQVVMGPGIDVSFSGTMLNISFATTEQGADKEGWNRFLSLVNVCLLSPENVSIQVDGELIGEPVPAVGPTHPWPEIAAEWDDEPEVLEVLEVLAGHGVPQPDDHGEELRGVATIARWQRDGAGGAGASGAVRVALVLDGDREEITGSGEVSEWSIIEVGEVLADRDAAPECLAAVMEQNTDEEE